MPQGSCDLFDRVFVCRERQDRRLASEQEPACGCPSRIKLLLIALSKCRVAGIERQIAAAVRNVGPSNIRQVAFKRIENEDDHHVIMLSDLREQFPSSIIVALLGELKDVLTRTGSKESAS